MVKVKRSYTVTLKHRSLPQVVEFHQVSALTFWLRACWASLHVGVLGLYAPWDGGKRR
jgi:hypothetical protein